MNHHNVYTCDDFDHSPLIVFYETTRACDLMCVHCRADAQRQCHPHELTTRQAELLIDDLTHFPRPPLLVLTGGDPIKRPDVFELIEHARVRGLEVAMTPSATPLVTKRAIRRLKDAGLHRLAVSLDGADAATHDGFRRVRGSFDRTLEIIADARAVDLPVQINTTIARHNLGQVDAIAERLSSLDIVLWSVFFLVPTGRAMKDQRITPEEYEQVFEKLWEQGRRQPYAIKTTEAPHYRRFLLQRLKASGAPVRLGGPHIGTNDGRGIAFVSHTGEIFASGFLPILCGRFPSDSVVRVYQESPVFRSLRDADLLGGKCGACEFRQVCGGSRARAFAMTNDYLEAEPDCAYIPPKWEQYESDAMAV
jgi:MoaA/NifB/PqqE/SkfB family radical SAM enzyme